MRANGAAIRALREKDGLSLEQLSELAGFKTHSHLSHIERDEKRPSLRALNRIARALGVPVAAISSQPWEGPEWKSECSTPQRRPPKSSEFTSEPSTG
ncbi:helix-turn-helix domain-containing protein [Nocardiopsis alba]|uniref:helix-turn-helix domain-containing protein n=1 Tax=Nocardiopsis alba TaxID=53437 RepID=UPI003D715E01